MKTLTQAQFENLLLKTKGAKPVSFSALTNAKLKAPFNDVLCYTKVNGMVNAIYENSVNSQRQREGKLSDFVAESLPYGQWKNNSRTLIQHKEKTFLRLKRECIYYRFYIRLVNNKIVLLDHNKIKDYIPAGGVSVKQRLDKEVVVRNYDLKGICFATIDKQTYRVR